jgi:hypothetical protein
MRVQGNGSDTESTVRRDPSNGEEGLERHSPSEGSIHESEEGELGPHPAPEQPAPIKPSRRFLQKRLQTILDLKRLRRAKQNRPRIGAGLARKLRRLVDKEVERRMQNLPPEPDEPDDVREEGEPVPKRHRAVSPALSADSLDSSESRGPELKLKNIPELKTPTNTRRRAEWLVFLKRAFKGAPRRYRKGSYKILLALEYLDRSGGLLWESHLKKLSNRQRAEAEENWEGFEKWTENLIKDPENLYDKVHQNFLDAKQREGQTPFDFHCYLESLEDHLPEHEEKEKAAVFRAKLLPKLREHLELYSSKGLQTRDEWVQEATRVWDRLSRSDKRKNRHDPNQEEDNVDSPRKRHRAEKDGGRQRSRNWNHRRDNEWHQGNPRQYQDRRGSGVNRRRSDRENETSQDPSPEKGACYNCGKKGHFKRDCPELPDAKSVNEVQTGTGANQSGKGRPSGKTPSRRPK